MLAYKEQEGQKQSIGAKKDEMEVVTCERGIVLCRWEPLQRLAKAFITTNSASKTLVFCLALSDYVWLHGTDVVSSANDKIGLIGWWRQHLLNKIIKKKPQTNKKSQTERRGKKAISFGRKKDVISAEALCSGKCWIGSEDVSAEMNVTCSPELTLQELGVVVVHDRQHWAIPGSLI